MKVYRFAVQSEEDGFLFLQCINDPKLFTQARSLDEALLMARDVVESMYEYVNVVVELVITPEVVTEYARRRARRRIADVRRKLLINNAQSRLVKSKRTSRHA